MKLKCVKWNKGWYRIQEVTERDGWLVEIGHNPDSYHPYCVHFGGNGQYFKTLPDAQAYCRARKWMAGPEVVRMDVDRCQREGWSPFEVVRREKGRDVDILYNDTAEQPYCVLNRGRGYPFNSLYEARAFCVGRGWLGNRSRIYEEVADGV